MTIKQFISNIQNDANSLNPDAFLSPKWIYYKAMTIANDFVAKSNTATKGLYKLQEGWSSVECLDMEEVPITSCGEIDTYICEKLMKSKFPIPSTFTSRFGNVIKYVSSNNFGNFYDPTTPRTWKAIQKREFKDRTKRYYWFSDNYLYIPIPKGETITPESIRFEAWLIEPWKGKILSAESKCGCDGIPCINPLEEEMPIPAQLVNDVSLELYKQLQAMYLRIPKDDYPNISQEKTNDQDIQTTR